MRPSGTPFTACPRSSLLSVTRAVTLTTESRGRPVSAAGRKTLPGMVAIAVLDVMTATMTVASRLSLYEADWTTGRHRRPQDRLLAGPGGHLGRATPRIVLFGACHGIGASGGGCEAQSLPMYLV